MPSTMDKSSKKTFKCPMEPIYRLDNIYIFSIVLIAVSSSVTSQLQTTRDLAKPFVTSNFFDPARTNEVPLQTATAPTVSTTTGDIFLSSSIPRGSSYNSPPNTLTTLAQTQRSLKFTLIAGKYWKFNIKTNSLLNNREKELRLHRNLSANNYIIDDDGWFQYNHQQQQLFAWPSYNTKPATYYFVLLPSGLDYEADGENSIRNEDVVANIVVELIEPYTTSRLNLDHLVDHKFSLDYLHRHSSYPLLLSQILSIFDILARSRVSQNTTGSPQSIISETITTTTASSNIVLASLQQNKQARPSRLGEFLLIDAQTSQDGEFFSITWTTHPSLVNNAPLLPINDCRLNTINETISKLSSRSALYPNVDSKFVISYSLEGPLVNSAAIIPTEKGNYALKLSLNGPCKQKKIVEELGLSPDSGIFDGLSSEADEKENGIVDVRDTFRTKQVPTTTASSAISATQSITQSSVPIRITTREPVVSISPTAISTGQIHKDSSARSIDITETTQSSVPSVYVLQSSTSSKNDFTSLPGFTHSKLSSAVEGENTTTNTRRALGISTEQASLAEAPTPTPPPHLQFAPQHQPKSFANFLEPSIKQPAPTAMADVTNTEISKSLTANSIPTGPTTNLTISNSNATTSTLSSTESGQETTLNDDLMGILNDTMDYLVSIAVPLSIIFGIILVVSILIAICSLRMKRRKSKKFEVGDRFKFRYGSERKVFLKNSSKPVILEADQKSLSMGGTPVRKPRSDLEANETNKMLGNSKGKSSKKSKKSIQSDHSGSNFFSMHVFPSRDIAHSSGIVDKGIGCADFGTDSGKGDSGGADCALGDFGGGDCGGGDCGGGDCGGGDCGGGD